MYPVAWWFKKKPLFPQQICDSLICTNDAIIANIKKDPPSKKKHNKKKTTTKTKPKQKKKLPKNKTKDLPPAHEKIPNKTKRKQSNIQKQTKQRWLFFFHSTFDCIKKINEFYL